MECTHCGNDNWDKIEYKIVDYIFTNTYNPNGCMQVDQVIKFKCLECGYEWEECIPMDDLY